MNVNQAFTDQTHLSGYGGYLLSKNMIAGIKKNLPELARFVVDDFKAMDLTQPEPPPAYLHQSPGPGSPQRGKRVPVSTEPATSVPSPAAH